MDQINFFKCLADETRFNIVMLVLGNNEQCVCDLTEKLELSQPKISRHLALLRSSGLLQDRRQGQWVKLKGWGNIEKAREEILSSIQAYPDHH